MDEQLQELLSEVQQLKGRVAYLEEKMGFVTTNGPQAQKAVSSLAPEAPRKTSNPKGWSRLMGIREEDVAGIWFNRMGILAILLSISFFIKWSFDNHFIGEVGRIMIGIVLGLGFLGGGEYFQRRNFLVYGQGFTGGGIATLYFSIYAAFGFYHLISQPIAFLFMILITLVASLLALRYDAKAIGIIGIVGGFVTPLLLGNGHKNHVVFFTYITILDIGVLLIAYYKRWLIFNIITLLFTYFSFALGRYDNYTLYTSQGFDFLSFSYLTLFFIIYLGVSFIRSLRLQETFSRADSSLILMNAVAYFSLSRGLLLDSIPQWIGFWSLFLGGAYLLLGLLVYRRYPESKNLSLTFLTVAIGFMTLAVPLQMDGYWIPMAWAIEAVMVFYLNFRIMPTQVPVAGYVILSFALLSLFVQPFFITGQEGWIFLNKGAVAYLAVIFSMLFICWLYHQQLRETRAVRKYDLLGILKMALNLLIIYFFTQETTAYFDYQRRFAGGQDIYALWNMQKLVLSFVWGLYGGVLIMLGFWRRWQGIRLFGIAFLGIVIMKVLFYDLSHLSTQNRIMSFMALGVILLTVSWLYHRYKQHLVGRDEDDEVIH